MSEEEKDKGGRPPIHTDPKEVERLINDYYVWIEGEIESEEKVVNDKTGVTEIITKWKRRPEPPTVTGLTLHLGFCHKSSLYDYAEKPEFSYSIKKAISSIEKYHEMKTAYGDKCVGNIFILKNFGWKDSKSIDHTTDGQSINLISLGDGSKPKSVESHEDD